MIINKNKIINAIEQLSKGNIIIYKTDTIYGLGADATNSKAIEKINNLKGRNIPLSIMISNIKSINKYAYINKEQNKKISKLLPGPYTILLNARKNDLSYLVQQESIKIGIRIPNNQFCLNLLKRYNKPIITTSINFHGEKSLNKIEEIQKIFFNINIYGDKNNIDSNGSTIIDFTINPPNVLRLGDGTYKI
tara:strand:+ start:677 stop:1252 length:576 start_codon:yes stop_codon:yes gene_type:complete